MSESKTPRHDALRIQATERPLEFKQLEVWAALAEAENDLADAHARISELEAERERLRCAVRLVREVFSKSRFGIITPLGEWIDLSHSKGWHEHPLAHLARWWGGYQDSNLLRHVQARIDAAIDDAMSAKEPRDA